MIRNIKNLRNIRNIAKNPNILLSRQGNIYGVISASIPHCDIQLKKINGQNQYNADGGDL